MRRFFDSVNLILLVGLLLSALPGGVLSPVAGSAGSREEVGCRSRGRGGLACEQEVDAARQESTHNRPDRRHLFPDQSDKGEKEKAAGPGIGQSRT
jgi:hypothetical protein